MPGGFQEPINDAGVAEHNGELWVVGGGGQRASEHVRVFDPQTEQWRDGPDLPMGVSHAPLVSTGQKLYLLGGLTTGDVALDTVYSLDAGDPDGTWIEETRLPEPRFAALPPGMVIDSSSPEAPGRWPGKDGRQQQTSGRCRAERGNPSRSCRRHARNWWPRPRMTARSGSAAGRTWDGGYGRRQRRRAQRRHRQRRLSHHSGPGAAAVWTPETGICRFGGSTTLPNDNPSKVKLVDCLAGSEPDLNWPDLPEARYGTGRAVIGDTVYVVGVQRTRSGARGAVIPAR